MLVYGDLIAAGLEELASDPTTGLFSGRIYRNTTSGEVRVYSGSTWKTVVDRDTVQTLSAKTIDSTCSVSVGSLPVVTPSKGGTGVANNDAATLTRSGNHPLTLATTGSTSLTLPTSGTVATIADITTTQITGILAPSKGGTGVANNDAATLTRSGSHALTLTTTAPTSLTLPTTGTVATLSGAEALSNKSITSSTFNDSDVMFNTAGSTSKQLQIPRLTTSERLALTNPSTGRIVFDTTAKSLFVYNGSSWSMSAGFFDPSDLSDENATRLGYKAYLSNTPYASGIVPTVTSSVEGSITNATLIPYKTQDGAWRIKGSIPSTKSFKSFAEETYSILYNSAPLGQYSMAVQSDGKVLLGSRLSLASGQYQAICRFNADGTPDTAFNSNIISNGSVGTGYVSSIVVQSDGKILVGGDFGANWGGVSGTRFFVRLNSDGTLDTSFNTNLGTGFNGRVNAIALQSDGKILVGGDFNTLNGATRNRLIRLNSNGSLDAAFYTNLGSAFNNSVNAIGIQSSGHIVVGGAFTTLNGINRTRIVRLDSSGVVDTAFSTNLGTSVNDAVKTLVIRKSIIRGTTWVDVIVIGGDFTSINGGGVNGIAQLGATGFIDWSLTYGWSLKNDSGGSGTVSHIALGLNEEIYVIGNFARYESSFEGNKIRNNFVVIIMDPKTNWGRELDGGNYCDNSFSVLVSVDYSGAKPIVNPTNGKLLIVYPTGSPSWAVPGQINLDGTRESGGPRQITYTISGVTFSGSTTQVISGCSASAFTTPATGVITLVADGAKWSNNACLDRSGCTFDVSLSSKPTWAF